MAAATLAHEDIIPDSRREELYAYLLPLEERIRERAYQLWLLRADQPGSDVTDWLNAEADILAEIPL